MSYPKKPLAPARKPLTEEEKKQDMMMAALQKKASLAENILYNLVQGCLYDDSSFMMDNCKKIVKMASDMADEFMRIVYGQEITYKETSEE